MRCWSSAGGEEEAQAAYDEAMNAVFVLQLECHRHTQAHKSKKDDSIKWAMVEMWPMMVGLCTMFNVAGHQALARLRHVLLSPDTLLMRGLLVACNRLFQILLAMCSLAL